MPVLQSRSGRLGTGVLAALLGYQCVSYAHRLGRQWTVALSKMLIAPPHFLLMPAAGRATLAGELPKGGGGQKVGRMQGRREIQGMRLHVLDDESGWLRARAPPATLSYEPVSASVAFDVPAGARRRAGFRSLGAASLGLPEQARFLMVDATCTDELWWHVQLHTADLYATSTSTDLNAWQHGFATQRGHRQTHRLALDRFEPVEPGAPPTFFSSLVGRACPEPTAAITNADVTGVGFAIELAGQAGVSTRPFRLVVHGVRVAY